MIKWILIVTGVVITIIAQKLFFEVIGLSLVILGGLMHKRKKVIRRIVDKRIGNNFR